MEDALLYSDSTHTILSFRDVCKNGLHVETHVDNKEEFLLFIKLTGYGKQICEKFSSLQTGLYFTYIRPIEHVAYKIIFQDVDTIRNWHDRLGRPRIGMTKKIIDNSIGHDMENAKFSQNKDFCCTACATEKLILILSYLKIRAEPLKFLERIQGDICGLIQPLSGPFRYFMVFVRHIY
jgi:hypothetical protein